MFVLCAQNVIVRYIYYTVLDTGFMLLQKGIMCNIPEIMLHLYICHIRATFYKVSHYLSFCIMPVYHTRIYCTVSLQLNRSCPTRAVFYDRFSNYFNINLEKFNDIIFKV